PLLVDMHNVGDGLLEAGFIDPVLEVNHYILTYRSQDKLISELEASGMLEGSMDTDKIKSQPPNDDGVWPVTYEVIYAH
ncbi:hypothetical protein NL529_33720, partial [Klebsiella pneumoniae]|nr:hypothetical protein [Klebsiella pneumoniae]